MGARRSCEELEDRRSEFKSAFGADTGYGIRDTEDGIRKKRREKAGRARFASAGLGGNSRGRFGLQAPDDVAGTAEGGRVESGFDVGENSAVLERGN